MYITLDKEQMTKVHYATRRRKIPLTRYKSTILLKHGSDITLIPTDSEIRYVRGHWEAHTPISNKKIIQRIAQNLDAIAFLVDE